MVCVCVCLCVCVCYFGSSSNSSQCLHVSLYLMSTLHYCLGSAAEAHDVQHAISCGSDLAFLTANRIRNIESFPWRLPAGWYALHVANDGQTKSIQRKTVNVEMIVPANLPTSCIVAVIKLGTSKLFEDFSGDPWALGHWCQAIEDIAILQSCIPVTTQELQRLWVLPERVRYQVQACVPQQLSTHPPVHKGLSVVTSALPNSSCAPGLIHVPMRLQQESAASIPTSFLLDSSTPARALKRAEVACNVEEGRLPTCKRLRLHLLHDSFPQVPPPHVDRLQRLNPHARDNDCYMDDKLHQYFICGEPYSLSVSGWWKLFFEEFDPERVSKNIVQRHFDTPGFRSTMADVSVSEDILASSVYNFAQHVRVLERRGNEEFLKALREVAMLARDEYARHCGHVPFSVDHVVELGRNFLIYPRKPEGPSCYYLMFLYTVERGPEQQAVLLAQTWHLHGRLESLKGTYLHKKIELFINALVMPMERKCVSHMAVEDLLREPLSTHEYAAEAVMQQIAWAQDPELWNHPLAQEFLEREMCGESVEFGKFRAWLSTKPRWSPFRLEWSLYNEDLKVAGQLDSLWIDLDNGGTFVMADWKRARELLTNDVVVLERQAFGRMGFSCCSHLYDTAWSHYFVQQTLYAYMLASKYGLAVRKMMLVQCHPDVCGSSFNEAPLTPDFSLADSLAAFLRGRLAAAIPPFEDIKV